MHSKKGYWIPIVRIAPSVPPRATIAQLNNIQGISVFARMINDVFAAVRNKTQTRFVDFQQRRGFNTGNRVPPAVDDVRYDTAPSRSFLDLYRNAAPQKEIAHAIDVVEKVITRGVGAPSQNRHASECDASAVRYVVRRDA